MVPRSGSRWRFMAGQRGMMLGSIPKAGREVMSIANKRENYYFLWKHELLLLLATVPLNYRKWVLWRQGSEKSICRSSPPVKRCQFASLSRGSAGGGFSTLQLCSWTHYWSVGYWFLNLPLKAPQNQNQKPKQSQPNRTEPNWAELSRRPNLHAFDLQFALQLHLRFSVFQSILTVQKAISLGIKIDAALDLFRQGEYPGKIFKILG